MPPVDRFVASVGWSVPPVRPRALFFGTPEFAVPCLDALVSFAEVPAVVCQPDRPAGRGKKLRPPPVKVRAEELGIEVLQPTKVRTRGWADRVRSFDADVALVVAYGRILPSAVLDAPRLGCVNVHASLLPRWRGAGPIQWAVAAGDAETGVCLMQMDEGMDTGPVLARRSVPIGPDELASELMGRLAALGAELVREELPRFVAGSLEARPQPEQGVTMAPLLRKEDGELRWDQPAQRLHDRARGMTPWPGAFFWLRGERVKVHRTKVGLRNSGRVRPGSVLYTGADGIEVACGEGSLLLLELQPEGKRRMNAREFLAGRRWSTETVLTADEADEPR